MADKEKSWRKTRLCSSKQINNLHSCFNCPNVCTNDFGKLRIITYIYYLGLQSYITSKWPFCYCFSYEHNTGCTRRVTHTMIAVHDPNSRKQSHYLLGPETSSIPMLKLF